MLIKIILTLLKDSSPTIFSLLMLPTTRRGANSNHLTEPPPVAPVAPTAARCIIHHSIPTAVACSSRGRLPDEKKATNKYAIVRHMISYLRAELYSRVIHFVNFGIDNRPGSLPRYKRRKGLDEREKIFKHGRRVKSKK